MPTTVGRGRMHREAINPDGLIDSTGIGYSQAVVADGTFYMSGQVGWDADFELAGDDIASQARQAFANVETLLAEVEADLSNVAKVTSYLVEPHDRLEAYLGVWNEVFEEEPYPCHTLLGVDQLAQEGCLVEIEVEVPLGE